MGHTVFAQDVADSTQIADSIGNVADTVPTWDELMIDKMTKFSQEADRNYFNTGISVYDLTADSLIYGYNQHKLMRPASIEKILTAVAALDQLGVSHNYETSVYTKGVITVDSDSISTLEGDVYVIGDFDPKLEDAHLKQIVSALKNLGIDSISGKLIADLSMKDTVHLGSGWCWDDEQPYLTPLSLGGSAYECTKARINKYSPSDNFLTSLSKDLAVEGISVKGGIGTGVFQADGNSLLVCKITHSIGDILTKMMKNSDNLYAESMFYQLAADKKKGISYKDCAAVVENVIAKTGASSLYAEIFDGCGLSLYDYVTPSTEVALLRYAYQHENIFSPLYNSLPIAGVDGTIKNRMTSGAPYKNVHAKTGTVTGVSSLAGYVTASNGHLLAFCIICNGLKKAADGKAFQDRICYAMSE